MTMHYGVYVPNFGAFADMDRLFSLARDAESAGWDGFYLWDHLAMMGKLPTIDAWTATAGIAATTDRIRVGPILTPLARRRPWKVAREVASLDHLSGGRVTIGVGLGEPGEAEYAAFGEDSDPRVRAEKLDEALEVVAGLWKGERFSHNGDHFRVDGVTFLPRPLQSPRPPIWVGGFWPNKAPMRRAARWDGAFPLRRSEFADAFSWSDLWLSPEELDEVGRFVAAERAGKEGKFDLVATGATAAGDPVQAADSVALYQAVGATWWLEWLDEERGSFENMRDRIRSGPPRR